MSDWAVLAHILRPRGNKGEVVADGAVANCSQLLELKSLYVFPPGEPVTVDAAWVHDGRLVLKLRGVDSISAAETLRNAEIRVPIEDRPEAGAGEFYFSDLIGCAVVDQNSGAELGVVADCMETSGPILLVVTVRGRTEPVLIPFANAICRIIDVRAKRITVDLPDGLMDLDSSA